ncbi:hemolysin family protein [Rothia sp. ND6WE1A]|uniref:hemolysin family protein n=1 Tax=Rothia sp. ND6WE1A TaxID=1848190 RepID=UPI000832E212|nr:hemolysin family protein [Rothia sp. ND6WE1A]
MVIVSLIFATLLLLVVGYILAATESAFTYIPHSELDNLVESGKRSRLNIIIANIDQYMFSLRLWSAFVDTLAILGFYSLMLVISSSTVVAILITAVVMTCISYVFFAYYPRRSGRARPLHFVKNYASLTYFLTKILGPLPQAVVKPKDESGQEANSSAGYFTEEEILEFVDRASSQDVIEDDEAQMVQSIFELGDTRIKSVMVPRTDMVTIDADETVDNAVNLFLRSGYSRIPVLGDDFDDIRGVLYFKDLMQNVVDSGMIQSELNLETLIRPGRFEPESKKVLDLLREMQRESTHVAMVIDEYGGTAGLVTLEDLIEELVGDIADEYDNEKPEIKVQDDGTFKISSRLSVEELGEFFGEDLEEEDVDTVGGLMSKHLGRVPIVGSEISVSGIHIRAIGTSGRRNQIATLLVWTDEKAHTGSVAVDSE